MSFPTPVLGFTIRNLPAAVTETVIAQFETLVGDYEDSLRANLDRIDPAGMIDVDETLRLSDELVSGYANLVRYHSDDGWDIPTTDGNQFICITFNDGADGADELDRLSLLVNACNAVPEFGKAVGILGEGIRLH